MPPYSEHTDSTFAAELDVTPGFLTSIATETEATFPHTPYLAKPNEEQAEELRQQEQQAYAYVPVPGLQLLERKRPLRAQVSRAETKQMEINLAECRRHIQLCLDICFQNKQHLYAMTTRFSPRAKATITAARRVLPQSQPRIAVLHVEDYPLYKSQGFSQLPAKLQITDPIQQIEFFGTAVADGRTYMFAGKIELYRSLEKDQPNYYQVAIFRIST